MIGRITRRPETGANRAAGMAGRFIGTATVWLMLAACESSVVKAPSMARLSDEVVRTAPPIGDDSTCWVAETTPAIIETITEQSLVTAKTRNASATSTTPATFRSTTRQRMVQEREDVFFRAPCPSEMTVEFIATLQRSLKARGLYLQPLTGVMDATTAEAIRRFQVERGLDSRQLSLAAAKELGIISTELDAL